LIPNFRLSRFCSSWITFLLTYRARWEIELLFKKLKLRFGLNEINTTDPYVIEVLIIVAAMSLLMSRVMMNEIRKLDAKR